MKIIFAFLALWLLFQFPPGRTLEWMWSGVHFVFPIGWCLWISALATIAINLLAKH